MERVFKAPKLLSGKLIHPALSGPRSMYKFCSTKISNSPSRISSVGHSYHTYELLSYPTTANVDVLLGFCAITVTVLEDNLILVLRFYLTLLLNAFIEVTRIGPIGIVLVRTEHMAEKEKRKRSRTRRCKRSGGSFSPRKLG